MSTEIAWTDETWNPTVGCSRVSPGCDGCYAIRVAHRGMQEAHRGLTFMPAQGRGPRGGVLRDARPDWTGEVRCLPDRLETPLHWRKPRRVFVDSMSDLFHQAVPVEFIADVLAVMARCPQHTFQVLTKRPQRMRSVMNGTDAWGRTFMDAVDARMATHDERLEAWPWPNVWLGTSVENQQYADLRIPHLLATPAAVRFLSIEPLLGPIDLRAPSDWLARDDYLGRKIDWVIIGGESDPGARLMEREWAESIVEQCKAAGVAVFVKQLGTVLGGKRHADIDTFPAGLQVREFPA